VLLSLVLVFALGYIFRRFLLPGPKSAFVIELPPYHIPTLKSVLLHTWQRTREFVFKAGTLIFLFAIILWFLASFPSGAEYGSAESYIGRLGNLVEPLFAPLGFGWAGSVSLLFGFFAKEIVISSFAILYNVSDENTLAQAMSLEWSALQAYVFMVFVLIYTPCMAAIATIRQETKSWKWTAFAVGYAFLLAWVVSYIVLNMGHMLGYS
jgi:ferrous iron transport protein B